MSVQTHNTPSIPGPDIEAGVIEDARARQRRQRRIGVALAATAAAAAAAVMLGLSGGGNGHGSRGGDGGHSPGAGGFGPGSHQAGARSPAPPRSTSGLFVGSASAFVCFLAPADVYLPRRSGCVSVLHADVDGTGRSELVILYATLGRTRIDGGYVPAAWTLEIARNSRVIHRIRVADRDGEDLHPFILRLANVNDVPGDEIFLQPQENSSGSPETLYTFSHDALLAVGSFTGGGDSATRERFFCQAKPTPRIIQQSAELLGPTIYGRWRWMTTTYRWAGSNLEREPAHSFIRRGLPPLGALAFGGGCGRVVGQTGDE